MMRKGLPLNTEAREAARKEHEEKYKDFNWSEVFRKKDQTIK
jgi:hypothetical protein